MLLSGLVAAHRPTEMALPPPWHPPPPPWRLANPKPELKFERHDYTAEVRIKALPTYSAPYPHGLRLSTYRRGTRVNVVDAQVSACGTYLSALTVDGEWISVWTLTNLRGEPRGVNFCRLTANPPWRSSRTCGRWRPDDDLGDTGGDLAKGTPDDAGAGSPRRRGLVVVLHPRQREKRACLTAYSGQPSETLEEAAGGALRPAPPELMQEMRRHRAP